MIFKIPSDFMRIRAEQFKWFVKTLTGTKVVGGNGTGYYDSKNNLVALETNGSYYVKP